MARSIMALPRIFPRGIRNVFLHSKNVFKEYWEENQVLLLVFLGEDWVLVGMDDSVL